MIRNYLILFIVLLLFSCTEKNPDFKTETDINNKFTVDVPRTWTLQNKGNEYVSIMRIADTSKHHPNGLLFDVAWESKNTKLTNDFQTIMDSIAIAKNWIPKNQEFISVNEYEAYYFETIANDSLGNFDFAMDNRYLNQSEKDGTIFFTVTRWKEKLNIEESIMVENIFESLTRK